MGQVDFPRGKIGFLMPMLAACTLAGGVSTVIGLWAIPVLAGWSMALMPVCLAGAQWLMLRGRSMLDWRWVLAAGIGGAMGSYLGYVAFRLATGLFAIVPVHSETALLALPLGAALAATFGGAGFAQWAALQEGVTSSGVWVPLSALAGAVAGVIMGASLGLVAVALEPLRLYESPAGSSIVGIIASAFAGLAYGLVTTSTLLRLVGIANGIGDPTRR